MMLKWDGLQLRRLKSEIGDLMDGDERTGFSFARNLKDRFACEKAHRLLTAIVQQSMGY